MANVYVDQATYFRFSIPVEEVCQLIKDANMEHLPAISDLIEEKEDGTFCIMYQTDGEGVSSEEYDEIVSLLLPFSVGLSKEVWSTECKGVVNNGVNYYNKKGEEVDIDTIYANYLSAESTLRCVADALWGEDADKDWSPDTVQAIADAIMNCRPDIYHEYEEVD